MNRPSWEDFTDDNLMKAPKNKEAIEKRQKKTVAIYAGVVMCIVAFVVFVQAPKCDNSDSRLVETSEIRSNTPLSEVVDLAVTIENPTLGDRARVTSRFDYLFSRLSNLCGGTPMQHGSVAAALRREVVSKGVEETMLDFVEQYHRIVTSTGVFNADLPDRSETCRELAALYSVLRPASPTSKAAADDLIYLVNEIGWQKWDVLLRELQQSR